MREQLFYEVTDELRESASDGLVTIVSVANEDDELFEVTVAGRFDTDRLGVAALEAAVLAKLVATDECEPDAILSPMMAIEDGGEFDEGPGDDEDEDEDFEDDEDEDEVNGCAQNY